MRTRLSLLGLLALVGCSSKSVNAVGGLGATAGDAAAAFDAAGAGDSGSGAATATCNNGTNFQCAQVTCPSGATTSVHGTVYDPAGQLPLYNVAVYVPNAAPQPIAEGATCGDCSSWYTAPVVGTLTDAGGNFTLTNVPVGPNIPLIVQVGKWRKIYSLSNVARCVENDAASLAGGMLRMPKNRTEGSIPNIAISTGALDSLECLIRRVGVDASEYTGDPTTGPDKPRIHIFTGGNTAAQQGGAQTQNPTSKPSYQNLWNRDDSMTPFDVVLLSCEGNETSYLNDAGRSVLFDYTNSGGRVFASHLHYSWFTPTGPFATAGVPLATWSPDGVAGKSITVGPNGDLAPPVLAKVVTTLPNGAPFPGGVALHSWLSNVGALTNDELSIWYARHNADLGPANTASQGWLALDSSNAAAPGASEYFSFGTPIGPVPSEQCGRVVYSDLHVSGGIDAENDPTVPADYPGLPITPDGCAEHPLTPQEKALEFMLFDLSSCPPPASMRPIPPGAE